MNSVSAHVGGRWNGYWDWARPFLYCLSWAVSDENDIQEFEFVDYLLIMCCGLGIAVAVPITAILTNIIVFCILWVAKLAGLPVV